MRLEEAKELLESEGYIIESFKDDLQLNEARKPKIKLIFGIRKRIPGAKCKPAFATFEEANEYMDKFTYPQDFEIVNLLLHPELLEEDFTKLYDTTKTSSFPYTRLTKELEMLIIKLSWFCT